MIVREKDYLAHHGIKGQKWGIRRFQNKDGTRTAAGKKREKEQSSDGKLHLTDKQKKYIKIGAAVAATALATYGAYKIYQNKDNILNEFAYQKMKTKMGKKNMDFIKNNPTFNHSKTGFDAKLGFSRKTNNLSIEKDIKNINPKYSVFNKEFSNNCGNCMMAFEMRRRGYNVNALGNDRGVKISHLGEFFSGLKGESFIQMTPTDRIMSSSGKEKGRLVKDLISSNISKQYKEDASGALFFPHQYGSHWINWIKDSSGVHFYDGQNPKIKLDDLFSMYKYNPNSWEAGLTSIRLDDLQINSSIHKMVGTGEGPQLMAQFDTFVDRGKNWVSRRS